MAMDHRALIKLNIGCGARKLPGYIGVDAVPRDAADIVAPAHKIPKPDGSVREIIAIHLWEHFYRWDCDKVIKEWHRLLAPGCLLILELPNLIKCCENLLSGICVKHPDQLSYWGLFGDPRGKDPYMAHRWGWTPVTLREFLLANGFSDAWEETTQFHPIGRDRRDMRIVARKAEQ
jgi:ubiquinone/menaquinone biosynthesis C-methylase UbiE